MTDEQIKTDESYMKVALDEARKAMSENEVAIGAVVVSGDKVVARAHNLTETLHDATAHAEMLALTMAMNYYRSKYTSQMTMYVTVEPCPMCAAAMALAKMNRVVYGTKDPKMGASLYAPTLYHPKCKVEEGILKEECSSLISSFFKNKR